MSAARSPCQLHWLHDFWDDRLSGEQVRQLEMHLSSCELCQSRFDEHLSSQQVVLTLDDSRDELCQASATAQSRDSATDVPTHDSLRELAQRMFPLQTTNGGPPDARRNDLLLSDEAGVAIGRIEHFDLLHPIGSGGMGFVYKAFDRRLHRLVALKVLSPSFGTTGAARQRFIREAQAAATINSPHVVPIHTVSQVAGLPYLVMTLVDGPDLQRQIIDQGPLALADCLQIARQVASGLRAAHRQGVVHRDVKPGNILLQPSIRQAALTDFGLAMVADEASLTCSGLTPGTPSYMSPEQARGSVIDHKSDWYSFGCVLYTMLVGHPPFRGPHAMAVLNRLQQETPKPPSDHRSEVPPWLDQLVLRLLERRPEARLADGEAIEGLLETCLAHVEQPGVHSPPAELLQRPAWWRQVPLPLVVSSACLLLLLLLIGFGGMAISNATNTASGIKPQPPVKAESAADGKTSSLSERSITPDTTRVSPTPHLQAQKRRVIQAQVLLLINEMSASEQRTRHRLQQLEEETSQLEIQP